MAKIYREVEDIQEPTPRPDVGMKKQPSAEPFDSQKAYGELKEGFTGLSERVEQMGNDVSDFKKKFDERFGLEQAEGDVEKPLEGEESTDSQDDGGETVTNVDNTTSMAPPQTDMNVNKQSMSKRKTIVGGRASEKTLNVKESVKEFLKGYGGVM